MISRNVSCRIFQARAEVEGGRPRCLSLGEPHAPCIGGVPPHHQGLFMTSIRFPIGVKEFELTKT
jgi:hypothetical protein